MVSSKLLLLTAASFSSSLARRQRFECGSGTPSSQLEKQFAQYLSAGKVDDDVTFDIPTFVHMVSAPNSKYAIPQSEYEDVVAKQIATLNEQFAPGGISFTLQNISHTENAAWATTLSFSLATGQELRRGGYDALNLYMLSDLGRVDPITGDYGGVLGVAELPKVIVTENVVFKDSVRAWQKSMPGGPYEEMNLGYTAVHEVGHWLGLWHVFPSSADDRLEGTPEHCVYDDQVADTPLQFEATELSTVAEGCDETKDTCPNSPGLDNVHNFMDYSSDFCMRGFTQGQFERMRMIYQKFRVGL